MQNQLNFPPVIKPSLWAASILLLNTACAPHSFGPIESDTASANFSMNTNQPIDQSLDNTEWQLQTSTLSAPISLRVSNNQISGNAGCNNYFGEFQSIAQDTFQLKTPLGSTMMDCSPAINNQEQGYLKALALATYYQIQNKQLVLFNKDRLAILEYSKVDSLTLENTVWQANSINNGKGGVVSNKHTPLATIQLSLGKAHGRTGCNNFSASYTLAGQKIHFGPARSTRKYCSAAGLMQQENNIIQALGQIESFAITAKNLYFRDANGALMLSFQQQPHNE